MLPAEGDMLGSARATAAAAAEAIDGGTDSGASQQLA
jgi:hypothetical protein